MSDKDYDGQNQNDNTFMTNKELVQRLMNKIDNLDDKISNLDNRLESTERIIKEYNNLRVTIGENEDKIQSLKDTLRDQNTVDETKSGIFNTLKDYTHWIVAILAILLYLSELGIF